MDIQEKLQNIRNEVQHLSTWDMLSITEPHTDYACKKKQVTDILNGLDEVLNEWQQMVDTFQIKPPLTKDDVLSREEMNALIKRFEFP